MPRKKKRVGVIDAETDPFLHGREPKPFIWGFYDGDEYIEFRGDPDRDYIDATEDLVEFLSDKDMTVYAHNGGKFDFFFLLPFLEKEKITVINGRISSCHIGKCCLKDSYNILPMPLSAYQKDEFEYWKMELEHRDKYIKEISRYLENDCVYLHDLVSAFIARFGAKLTIASAAMGKLKSMVEKEAGRPFDKMNQYIDSKYRRFYYGGRCQAFETGKILTPKKIYDINSAYPRAMCAMHPDPTFLSFQITDKLPIDDNCYFAVIKAVSKGALPYRCDEEERLLYPSDDTIREYYTTGWEIAVGRKTGTLDIKEVIEVRIPDKLRSFKPYVDIYYEGKKLAKAEGRKIDEIFEKLMLNSPYGKFALNPDDFKEYKIVDYGEFPDDESEDGHGEWELYSSWPEYIVDIYRRPSPKPFGYYNVSVAASITGWVRAYMWESICASKEVSYCDTDSIICNTSEVKVGKELGEWEYEGTSTETYIAGRKLYAMYIGNLCVDRWNYKSVKNAKEIGWKLASKGVRLCPKELAHISTTDESVKYLNSAPTMSLKRGVVFTDREVKKIV